MRARLGPLPAMVTNWLGLPETEEFLRVKPGNLGTNKDELLSHPTASLWTALLPTAEGGIGGAT